MKPLQDREYRPDRRKRKPLPPDVAAKLGPTKPAAPKAGPSKSGPYKPGPSKFGPSKYGPSKFGPSKFGSAKFGPPRKGPPQRTDWGNVAEWYDELVGDSGSEYHREVVLPGAVRLLGIGPGDSALDVACGQGVLCRLLRGRGVSVTGIDAAEELVKLAEERSDPDIKYVVADARDLVSVAALASDSFTAAACVLAIQNIDPVTPVFEGVARVLKPAGRFVLVMMHPCFRGPKAALWGWDDVKKIQFRRVDRYLSPRKEPIITHPGKDPHGHTWTYHRPLQAYVRALTRVGLLVDAMEEWPSHKVSDSGPRAPAENEARKEIPMFLALRAVKTAVRPPVSGS